MNKNFEFINKKSCAGLSFSILMAVYSVISFIGGALILALNVQGGYIRVISSIFPFVSLIGVSFFISKLSGEKFTALIGVKKFNAFYLLPAICLCVGMLFGFGWVNESLANIFGIPENKIYIDTIWKYFAYIVALAVLPAVGEELFFRGTLINLFGKSNIFIVSVISASFFALYHCSLAQFVYQFIFGIGMGILAVRSGSVFPSMVAHFLNNFIILTLNYLGLTIDLFSPIFIIIGVVLLAVFSTIIFLYGRKTKKDSEKENNGKILYFFLCSLFGIIICIALIISSMVV